MKIVLASIGTDGDARPMAHLAAAAVSAGHEVVLCLSESSAELANRLATGARVVSLDGDLDAFLKSDEAVVLLRGGDSIKVLQTLMGIIQRHEDTNFERILEACDEADVVAAQALAFPLASIAAERTQSVLVRVDLCPTFRTAEEPSMMLTPPRWLRFGFVNLLTHDALRWLTWLSMKRTTTRLREQNGLAARGRRFVDRVYEGAPRIVAFDPALRPIPRDCSEVEAYQVGSLRPPAVSAPQPPPEPLRRELEAFLDASDEPVAFLGWGSMSFDAELFTRLAYRTLHASGKRGIVQRGWAGIDPELLRNSDDPLDRDALAYAEAGNVLRIGSCEHAWLFPKMGVCVHHGGAGTTDSVLRAGVPQIVTSILGDQPWHGERTVELGIAPATFPLIGVDTVELGGAVAQAIDDPSYALRAKEVASAMSTTDAPAATVEALREVFSRHGSTIDGVREQWHAFGGPA